MSDKLKNMVVRTLTGVVYVGLLVGCTLYGPITAFLFFTLVSMATLWEFGTVMNRHAGASVNRPLNTLAGVCLSTGMWLMLIGGQGAARIFALYGFLLLYIIVSELFRKAENPIKNWAFAFASQVYVALPFALMSFLCIFPDSGRVAYVNVYSLAIFIFLWTNDTGAYLCGTTLSRFFPAKLFPRISPHKSWIGSIGGGVLCLAIAVLISYYMPGALNLYQWMGFAMVVVVMGTLGDLVESLIKRQLGIKDSGNILPGHGGMLDRFDSALLAIPAEVIYLLLIQA